MMNGQKNIKKFLQVYGLEMYYFDQNIPLFNYILSQLRPTHSSCYIVLSVRFILVLSCHVFLAFHMVLYLLSYRLKCTMHPLFYPVHIISYNFLHLITLVIFCED